MPSLLRALLDDAATGLSGAPGRAGLSRAQRDGDSCAALACRRRARAARGSARAGAGGAASASRATEAGTGRSAASRCAADGARSRRRRAQSSAPSRRCPRRAFSAGEAKNSAIRRTPRRRSATRSSATVSAARCAAERSAGAELSASEQARLRNIRLRRRGSADGQLRHRRAHRHRVARSEHRRAAVGDPGPLRHAAVDGARLGGARARRDARVVLHDRSARQPFGRARTGARLRQVQATFTEPWLAGVLAIGAVLAAYNGLVRRRVAETLGQALLVLAMIAGGSWVMLDPVGTVGALGGWANQAGLGTLAVTRARHAGRLPAARSPTAWARCSPRPSKCRGATSSSAMSAGVATRRGCDPTTARRGAGDRRRPSWRRPLRARDARSRLRGAAAAPGEGARTQRTSAARRAQQRRDLPGAAGQRRRSATRSTTTSRCCGRSARATDATAVADATAARGGVPHRPRHLAAGRGPAADRRGRAGHAPAARLSRAAPARFGALQPAVSDARARGRARSGAGRGRSRGVSQLGDAAAGRGRLQAAVLVPARRDPRGARDCWRASKRSAGGRSGC